MLRRRNHVSGWRRDNEASRKREKETKNFAHFHSSVLYVMYSQKMSAISSTHLPPIFAHKTQSWLKSDGREYLWSSPSNSFFVNSFHFYEFRMFLKLYLISVGVYSCKIRSFLW